MVLDDISLEIKQGDVVGIIGPSGTGKSTLLRCVNRLETPEKGTVTIGDKVIGLSERKPKELLYLRQNTGMVFQRFNLFEKKTALENVMEGLIVVKKMKKDEARAIALEELKLVGMEKWANHYPKHMSGGQQQRVALARALAMKPQILLLDEPTSGTAGFTVQRIGRLTPIRFPAHPTLQEIHFRRRSSSPFSTFFTQFGSAIRPRPMPTISTSPLSRTFSTTFGSR